MEQANRNIGQLGVIGDGLGKLRGWHRNGHRYRDRHGNRRDVIQNQGAGDHALPGHHKQLTLSERELLWSLGHVGVQSFDFRNEKGS